MKQVDNINTLLNRLHAMKSARVVKISDIAKGIKERPAQVSQWVMQRTRIPRADVAFKMQSFAAKMSLRIATQKRFQAPYRSAYHTACVLFPDGRDGR